MGNLSSRTLSAIFFDMPPKDKQTFVPVSEKCQALEKKLKEIFQVEGDGKDIPQKDYVIVWDEEQRPKRGYFTFNKNKRIVGKVDTICTMFTVYYYSKDSFEPGDVVSGEHNKKEVFFNVLKEPIDSWGADFKELFDDTGVLNKKTNYYNGYIAGKKESVTDGDTDSNAGSTEKNSLSVQVKNLLEEIKVKNEQLVESREKIDELLIKTEEFANWWKTFVK